MENRNGKFTGSRISELITEKGTFERTAYNYIFEKAVETSDLEFKDVNTKQMEHGIINEIEAFDICNILYPELELKYQADEFIEYNSNFGATPDATGKEICGDFKCPFTPFKFMSFTKGIPKAYFWQLKAQMMVTDMPKSFLFAYLTSHFTDIYGNKKEYPLPLENRYIIKYLDRVKEDEKIILKKVDDASIIRDEMIKRVQRAKEIDLKEFYKLSLDGSLKKFKDYPMAKNELLKLNIETFTDKYYYI